MSWSSQYPSLTDFNTPALALVEQNGVTYQTQLSPINTAIIGQGAITEDNLAANSVTTNAILDGSITGSKLAPGSITGSNLANGSVSGLAITQGTLPGSAIIAGTITGNAIQTGSVNASVLVPGSVNTLQIADGSVTTGKLASGAITSSLIADGSITGAKLAPSTIDGTQLKPGSVNGATIAYNCIGLSNLNPSLQAFFNLPVQSVYSSAELGTFSLTSTGIVYTFTAANAGWYHVSGHFSVTVPLGDYIQLYVYASTDSDYSHCPQCMMQGGPYGGTLAPYASRIIQLAAGDSVSLVGNTNAALTLNWVMTVTQLR